ncbi:MAG: response regulator [Deltaproteobacteria bacterium]|nr:response regulator [Deltaproteobacteria bacterium]
MVNISKLKSHFIAGGQLTEEQLRQAEDYAITKGINIYEALVFLNILDYETLGKGLAIIHGKPYHTLLINPPPDSAKALVPLKFAVRWKIFPIDYDAEKDILTLALDNPEDHIIIEKLRSIFSAHRHLMFVVASRPEINKAIDVYYKGQSYVPVKNLDLPEDFSIVSPEQDSEKELSLEDKTCSQKKILLLEPDRARSSALQTLLDREGYSNVELAYSTEEAIRICEENLPELLLVNGRTFDSQTSRFKDITHKYGLSPVSFYQFAPILLGQEYSYRQMSQALINLVMFLMKKSIKEDEKQLQEILTRARYCKLLALRLNLSPSQADGLILAAWLSSNKFGKRLTRLITTPYHLNKILSTDADEGGTKSIEANILKLVTKYQFIKNREPEVTQNINQVRKLLDQQSSLPENKAILEAFLRVIKDEEFLKKVDHPSRHILVVDPYVSQESTMVLRLMNDGYKVKLLPDAKSAVKVIINSEVDLVISEISLPETDGIGFCRALRKNASTAHIPFIFLTAEESERLAAECLEAGADDFLKKPIDPDLLSLKIQRLMANRSPNESKEGINGSLREMNITDMIQNLSAGEKNVRIMLDSHDKKGQIYIRNGEIVHAYIGSSEGENAFYRLMSWEEGNFRIVTCSDFPQHSIRGSTMSLLMEGARQADEEKK